MLSTYDQTHGAAVIQGGALVTAIGHGLLATYDAFNDTFDVTEPTTALTTEPLVRFLTSTEIAELCLDFGLLCGTSYHFE